MLNATFRSIERWPGTQTASYARKRSKFKASYDDTIESLEKELKHLRAKGIVIQVYLESSQIRNDGWPYSKARPKQPGVILSFQGEEGPLSFPCDRFNTWEDNLRAIALSLQALRTVDRYGVTRGSEQYQGFKQIAPPSSEMTPGEARTLLNNYGGYRTAAQRFHPDNRDTGSHEMFVKIQHAKAALEKAGIAV